MSLSFPCLISTSLQVLYLLINHGWSVIILTSFEGLPAVRTFRTCVSYLYIISDFWKCRICVCEIVGLIAFPGLQLVQRPKGLVFSFFYLSSLSFTCLLFLLYQSLGYSIILYQSLCLLAPFLLISSIYNIYLSHVIPVL